MVERSSRFRRGGPVENGVTIACICFLLWAALFVADETYERLIGIGLAAFGTVAQIRTWLRVRRADTPRRSEHVHS